MGDAMSLKQALLAAAQLRTGTVEVEGSTFTVREVSALAFAEYGEKLKTDREAAVAGLLAQCVLDENGELLLTVEEAHVVGRNPRTATPLMSKIMELSGFGEDAENKP